MKRERSPNPIDSVSSESPREGNEVDVVKTGNTSNTIISASDSARNESSVEGNLKQERLQDVQGGDPILLTDRGDAAQYSTHTSASVGSSVVTSCLTLPYDVPPPPAPQRSIEKSYISVRKLGEGSYGAVHLVRDAMKSSAFHAMKTFKHVNTGIEGFLISSIREIRILRFLTSRRVHQKLAERIVQLEEILMSETMGETALIFEYMEYDLYKVLNHPTVLSEDVVALYSRQLLEGVCFLRNCGIMHRDLKSSNILLNRKGELKICDFGMAREVREDGTPIPMSPRITTLWYKAPEVLLSRPQRYSYAVDVWAAGCILAEMILCRPLFRPLSDVHGRPESVYLRNVFELLGAPPAELGWDKNAIEYHVTLPPAGTGGSLETFLLQNARGPVSPALIDLISQALQLDPSRRPRAQDLLQHKYFERWVDLDSVQRTLHHKLMKDGYCDVGGGPALGSCGSKVSTENNYSVQTVRPYVPVFGGKVASVSASSSSGTLFPPSLVLLPTPANNNNNNNGTNKKILRFGKGSTASSIVAPNQSHDPRADQPVKPRKIVLKPAASFKGEINADHKTPSPVPVTQFVFIPNRDSTNNVGRGHILSGPSSSEPLCTNETSPP